MDVVAELARWTAAVRAWEQHRPDRLFRDELAALLAGPRAVAELLEEPEESRESPYIPIRTRYLDEWLTGALADGSVRQVVLVAAGMDTRAYRRDWPPGVRLWELDRPDLLDVKEGMLAEAGAVSRCDRRGVGVDLADPGWPAALRRAGHDPGLPSAWLVEGFLMYLERAQAEQVLGLLSACAAPGSHLAADLASQRFFSAPEAALFRELMEGWGAPWRWGTDRPEDLLAPHGWQVRAVPPGGCGANFGRWPWPVPPREESAPTAFFVTATATGRTRPAGQG